MAKKLSNQEVLRIAELSKLKFDDQSLQVAKTQLEFALEIIGQLDDIDVEDVEPTFLIGQNLNTFRQDQVEDWQQKEALLKNAPESADNLIKVPAILDEGSN